MLTWFLLLNNLLIRRQSACVKSTIKRCAFFKNRGSSCKRSLSLLPIFRAASLQKIGSKLFCRTGTLATQANQQ